MASLQVLHRPDKTTVAPVEMGRNTYRRSWTPGAPRSRTISSPQPRDRWSTSARSTAIIQTNRSRRGLSLALSSRRWPKTHIVSHCRSQDTSAQESMPRRIQEGYQTHGAPKPHLRHRPDRCKAHYAQTCILVTCHVTKEQRRASLGVPSP